MLAGLFGATMLVSSVFRNQYIYVGLSTSIRTRKILVTAMYNKVGKLSTKSLGRINTGKLVSLVSGDLFNLEKMLTITPMAVSGVLLNLTAYVLIGYLYQNYTHTAILTTTWLLTLLLQHLTANLLKPVQLHQSTLNDARIKLITDMVNGIRTIKAYAWESHYYRKIDEVRER